MQSIQRWHWCVCELWHTVGLDEISMHILYSQKTHQILSSLKYEIWLILSIVLSLVLVHSSAAVYTAKQYLWQNESDNTTLDLSDDWSRCNSLSSPKSTTPHSQLSTPLGRTPTISWSVSPTPSAPKKTHLLDVKRNAAWN